MHAKPHADWWLVVAVLALSAVTRPAVSAAIRPKAIDARVTRAAVAPHDDSGDDGDDGGDDGGDSGDDATEG